MKLKTRVRERVEDQEAAQRRVHAEQLADVAFPPPYFEEDERDRLQAAIESAQIRRPGWSGLQEELRLRLPKLATDLGRSEEEIRSHLAEMLNISRRRQAWLDANGIEEENSPDARQQAEAVLKWILRRRDALELRLADTHLSKLSRRRMEAELDELEKQENDSWSQLHRPVLFGQKLDPREAKCKCGAIISRSEKFQLGACEICRTRHLLRTGKPYPSVNA